MDVDVRAACSNRGETLKLQDLNAGVHRIRETISLAYYEASLLVEHIVDAYGDAGAAQAGARLRPGARHRRGAEGGAEHRPRSAAGRLRPDARADVRRDAARAARRRTDAELATMPLDAAEDAGRGDNPRSYPVQMALGSALRKAGQTRRGDAARSSAPRRWCRSPIGTESPHAQMAEIALEKKDRPRAITELTALVAVDFNNVEAARQLADAAARSGRRRSRRSSRRSTSASSRSIRSTPTRTPRSAAWRCSANDADAAVARVPRRARARTGRPGGGPHRSRARATSRPASAPRRRSRRSRRSRSRRATSARRTCCSSWSARAASR